MDMSLHACQERDNRIGSLIALEKSGSALSIVGLMASGACLGGVRRFVTGFGKVLWIFGEGEAGANTVRLIANHMTASDILWGLARLLSIPLQDVEELRDIAESAATSGDVSARGRTARKILASAFVAAWCAHHDMPCDLWVDDDTAAAEGEGVQAEVFGEL